MIHQRLTLSQPRRRRRVQEVSLGEGEVCAEGMTGETEKRKGKGKIDDRGVT